MSKLLLTALLTIEQDAGPELPNRNFVQLGEKPLFRMIVDKLWRTRCIAHIAIVTDSAEVRSTFRDDPSITLIDYPGTPDRERARGVLPTSDRIAAHALKKVPGEHFIQLSSTHPFLTFQSVDEAAHLYRAYVLDAAHATGAFDSVMSLMRIEKQPYFLSEHGPQRPEHEPFMIVEDTVLHIFSRTVFERNGGRKLGTRPLLFETPEIENLSVETGNAFAVARLVYENRRQFSGIFDRASSSCEP